VPNKEKPSEQFADLRVIVEEMPDGKDKADLLALFELADQLHRKAVCFVYVVTGLRAYNKRIRVEFEDVLKWRTKWLPLLRYLEKGEADGLNKVGER